MSYAVIMLPDTESVISQPSEAPAGNFVSALKVNCVSGPLIPPLATVTPPPPTVVTEPPERSSVLVAKARPAVMPVTGAVVAPTELATVNDAAVAAVTTALVKS